MENFIIIISFLLIGAILKRIPAFSAETGNVLNLFVIYVSLPALVLIKIPKLVIDTNILVPVIMPWIMLFFSAALVLFLSKFFKWDRVIKGCLLLVIPLGNTSFFGIPMVKAFFGDQAIPYALLYDQLGSFIALAIYGSIILAYYGTEKENITGINIAKKVISFPPFIALVLAFVFKDSAYPFVVENLLEMLAATLIPLVMIAVGFQLTLCLDKNALSPLGIGLSIKLIIAPLTALLLCRILGLEGESVKVSIFEAGMPPMVSAGALAILARLSPALTAGLVGLGIIFSFITLPLLFQFL